jgi:TonB family protein
MTPAIALRNLVAASEQAMAIVAVASLLVWLLRLHAPGVRYVLWRTLAIGCVLLPWVQHHRPVRTAVSVELATVHTASASVPRGLPGPNFDIAVIVLSVLGAGVAVRLVWLMVGVLRLRHLRRSGVSAQTALEEELQQTLRTRADVRYSTHVSQPVTFGLRTPVVLVPESLREQPLDVQRAVIGHELIHVKRRDWAWLLLEECAVSVFWFHPAAWWVASRIQLAREEVVDELAILLTGKRKPYVEALLAFSDPLSIVPTAAFARRRHLLRRIALITREDLMSSKRIVASCAVMAIVLPVGAWSAMSAFPLQAASVQGAQPATAPGPLERKAHPVTPENPVPRRIHYEPPVVPDASKASSAKVAVKVTLDESGGVAEARAIGIAAVGDGFSVDLSGDNLVAWLEGAGTAIVAADKAPAMRETIHALIESATTAIKSWRYDPPAEAPLTFTVTIRYGDEPETMAFSAKADAKALRVGGAIKPPLKLVDVRPVYPDDARAAGVGGTVIIEARIGADGSVEAAHVIKSIPLLDRAALDAVKQWKFAPTLMNGVPTPVIMTVTISFKTE